VLRTRLTTTTAAPNPSVPPTETLQPKYCSITQLCALTGMGRRTVYDLLGSGDLRAIKLGAKTLVDVEYSLAYLRSRPPAAIRPPRPRHQA
jgi:excisionase family DNA binding protein